MTDTMREKFENHMNSVYGNHQENDWLRTHSKHYELWQAAQADARALVRELITCFKNIKYIRGKDDTSIFVECTYGLTKAQAFMEGKL